MRKIRALFGKIKLKVVNYMDGIKDETQLFSKEEIIEGKKQAILSYVFALIPYYGDRKNKYVNYHAIKGMNLLIIELIYLVLSYIIKTIVQVPTNCQYGYFVGFPSSFGAVCKITPWWISLPLDLILIFFVIINIIGIMNVNKGKAKALPIIEKINILMK